VSVKSAAFSALIATSGVPRGSRPPEGASRGSEGARDGAAVTSTPAEVYEISCEGVVSPSTIEVALPTRLISGIPERVDDFVWNTRSHSEGIYGPSRRSSRFVVGQGRDCVGQHIADVDRSPYVRRPFRNRACTPIHQAPYSHPKPARPIPPSQSRRLRRTSVRAPRQ